MKLGNPRGVLNEVVTTIESKLNEIGIMFRIFGRVKDQQSIERKLDNDSEYGVTKKLQDLIGLRVVLYFNDDIQVVHDIVSTLFAENVDNVSIDDFQTDLFKAIRYNVFYSLSDELTSVLGLGNESLRIDNTFELQLRTIFSEGWHEVEHDLRYKCKTDWVGFDSQSRLLNGVYASLENNEWAMIKIFDDLAYAHYKSKKWSEMLRQKMRLRLVSDKLSEHINELFSDVDLAKKFFRLNRAELLMEMNRKGFYYPLTLDNVVLFANLFKVRDERVCSITPRIMIEDFSPGGGG